MFIFEGAALLSLILGIIVTAVAGWTAGMIINSRGINP